MAISRLPETEMSIKIEHAPTNSTAQKITNSINLEITTYSYLPTIFTHSTQTAATSALP
jgi:hypothetical protein